MNQPMRTLTAFIGAVGVLCFVFVSFWLGGVLVFAAIVTELALQDSDKRRRS